MNYRNFELKKLLNKGTLLYVIILLILPLMVYVLLIPLDKRAIKQNQTDLENFTMEFNQFEKTAIVNLEVIKEMAKKELREKDIDIEEYERDLENYENLRIVLLKYSLGETESLDFRIEFAKGIKKALEEETLRISQGERYLGIKVEELDGYIESLEYIKEKNLTYEETIYSPSSYNVFKFLLKAPVSIIYLFVLYYFLKVITLDDFQHGSYKNIIKNQNRADYCKNKIIFTIILSILSSIILLLSIYILSLFDHGRIYEYKDTFLGFDFVMRRTSVKYMVLIVFLQCISVGFLSLVFGRLAWSSNNYISYGIGMAMIVFATKYLKNIFRYIPTIIFDTNHMKNINSGNIVYLVYITLFVGVVSTLIYSRLMKRDFSQ